MYRFTISKVYSTSGDYEWKGKIIVGNCVSHLANSRFRPTVPAKEIEKMKVFQKFAALPPIIGRSPSSQSGFKETVKSVSALKQKLLAFSPNSMRKLQENRKSV
jgi:hypothetical protein